MTDEGLRSLEGLPLTYVSLHGAKMTKEGLARLQGAAKERKSARKPESVAAPGELSAGIVRELRRLGAKPVRTPKIPEEAQSWPAPIRSLPRSASRTALAASSISPRIRRL